MERCPLLLEKQPFKKNVVIKMAGFACDPIALAHKSPDYALDVYAGANPRASDRDLAREYRRYNRRCLQYLEALNPRPRKPFKKWPLPGETTSDEEPATPSDA